MSDRVREHFEANARFYATKTGNFSDRIWAARRPIIDRMVGTFGSSPIRLLDVGGGAGYLADRFIENYANVNVTIVDLSQTLLDANAPHVRKRLVRGDFREFLKENRQDRFDIINFDVILHHILSAGSFAESRRLQTESILLAKNALDDNGFVSIRELAYESLPFTPRLLTHRLLWLLTTRRFPPAIRSGLHSLGLQSQGAGVCFFHQDSLPGMLVDSGLELVENVLVQLTKPNWKYRAVFAANARDQYLVARNRPSNP